MNNPESSKYTSGKSFLPNKYEPSECDVICGRRRTRLHHDGNKAFRKSIVNSLQLYNDASSRRNKSIVVSDITNKLLFNGDESLRFIQFCDEELRWFELPYETVRLKVGQALLDNTIQLDPERRLKQKQSQQRFRLRRKGITSDIAKKAINLSGENVVKTSPLTTTSAQYVQKSRVDSDTVASEALKNVAPSEDELRLDSSREDITAGVSSFFEAHMSICQVSTADSGREEENFVNSSSSSSCGWFTDSEGRVFLQVLVL